ncbi:MAG: tetratricopeptide repeat protein [Myxococcaceae bacterium]
MRHFALPIVLVVSSCALTQQAGHDTASVNPCQGADDRACLTFLRHLDSIGVDRSQLDGDLQRLCMRGSLEACYEHVHRARSSKGAQVRLAVLCDDGFLAACQGEVTEGQVQGLLEWARPRCEHREKRACFAVVKRLETSGRPELQELLAVACQAGEVDACLMGLSAARLHDREVQSLEETCKGGDSRSCRRLACNSGDLDACFESQAAAESGRRLAVRACDLGDVWSCGLVSRSLPPERAAAVERARCRAGNLASCEQDDSACAAGKLDACMRLGNRTESALGNERQRMSAAFQSACARGLAPACVYEADLTEGDEGAKKLKSFCGNSGPAQLEACMRLGARDGAPGEFRADAYERACALGERRGCARVIDLLEDGDDVRRDLTRALAIRDQECRRNGEECAPAEEVSMLRSCETGTVEDCFRVGRRYAATEARPKKGISHSDYELAVGTLGTACDARHAAACADLGDLLLKGHRNGVAPDAALTAYERACSLGIATVCGKAERLKAQQEACLRQNSPDCEDWVKHFFSLSNTDRDEARGRELLAAACQRGSAESCRDLGIRILVAHNGTADPFEAAHWYRRAKQLGLNYINWDPEKLLESRASCAQGRPDACVTLVRAVHSFVVGAERPVPHLQEIYSAARKGCAHGDSTSCQLASFVALEGRVPGARLEDGLADAERACALGEEETCFKIGDRLLEHKSLPNNEARALRAFEKGCDAGNPGSCLRVGVALRDGLWGATRDETAAAAKFRQACDLGERDACDLLKQDR